MLVKHAIDKITLVRLVDEVEGIMILVGVKPTPEYLNALEKLPVVEIKKLLSSYAEEFKALTGKDVLVTE